MKHCLIFFALFLLIKTAEAQNATDELLDSRTAKNYIHFSLVDKKLYYEIDAITNKNSQKTLDNNFCITVPKHYSEINLVFDFINPFKQKIILSETFETDGSYASIGKFFTALNVLTDQVTKTTLSQTATTSPPPAALAAPTKAASEANKSVAILSSKSLTPWKYSFLSTPKSCVKPSDLFNILTQADQCFYRKANDTNLVTFFPTLVDKINQSLTSVKSVTELINTNQQLSQTDIPVLVTANSKAEELLKALKTWDYDKTFGSGCATLKDYTKETIDNFIDETTQLLDKRKAIVDNLKKINTTTADFLKTCVPDVNTMIVGRIPVDVEKVKIETIKLRDTQIKLDNNDLTVNEDPAKDIEIGKIRVRNYHFLIPEFALGVFYTNLDYPHYGTATNGTSTVVSGPENRNYSVVAAAHLNLVVNTHGLVNPMFQFGVGTAKELPSLLAGGGIRFSKPTHTAITFGALWTWRKELDKLKVGDTIANTAILDNDLTYKLTTKPSFYIGINYGF
jgi:hypothetical protein